MDNMSDQLCSIVNKGLEFCQGRSYVVHEKQDLFPLSAQEAFQILLMDSIILNKQTVETVKLLLKGKAGYFKRSENGISLDIIAIVQMIVDRHTIVFNHFERFMPSISILFKQIAEDCALFPHLNVYWTPCREFGAGRHSDEHDVCVLQIAGRKRWKLWQCEQLSHVNLVAGDILFIRHGVEHDPCALDEGSLHITIGFNEGANIDCPERVIAFYEAARAVPASGLATEYIPAIVNLLLGVKGRTLLLSPSLKLLSDADGVRFVNNGKLIALTALQFKALFQVEPEAGQPLRFRQGAPAMKAFSWCMRLLLIDGLKWGNGSPHE